MPSADGWPSAPGVRSRQMMRTPVRIRYASRWRCSGLSRGVNLLEGTRQSFAYAGRALDPALAGGGGLCGVECVAGHGVGKFGQRAAIVDFSLGPLGLEIVEDSRELADLRLVQLELVREKPQRPSDAQP